MDEATARVRELAQRCVALRERAPVIDTARPTTRERFARFYAENEELFRAAIAAASAVERAAVRPSAELEALSRVALADDAAVLDLLWGGLDDGLSYIGTDAGFFYGGQPWSELCVVRSGIELLAELAGHADPTLGSDAREIMQHWAVEMYRVQEIPEGIPSSHWWWRSPHP